MRSVYRVALIGFACAVLFVGCGRRALLVSQVPFDAMHVQGQTFCLAKGIVSLVVSSKPSGGGGDAAPPDAGQSPNPAGQSFDMAAGEDDGVAPSGENGAGAAATLKASVQTLSLTVSNVRFIPDCDFQYAVSLDHDVFHADDVTIEIDPITKLLKGVNSSMWDRTPAIVEKLAKAPGEIFGPGGEAGEAAPRAKTPRYYEIRHDVDPTDKHSVDIFNGHLAGLQPRVRLGTRPLMQLPTHTRERAHCQEDLCFRTAMPYVVELISDDAPSPRVISQQIVVVPNPYLIASVPVTRAPFVKKEVILEFRDGMLSKSQIKNPSEVLEFVGIPINVAKAIVSIPSAMLKFELLQTQNDGKLLLAQKELIDNQKGLVEAQQQLLAAAAAKNN